MSVCCPSSRRMSLYCSKERRRCLVRWLSFVTLGLLSANSGATPTSLQPEMVAILAMTTSDESRAINNEATSKGAQDLRTSAQFATRMDAKLSWLDNQNEPAMPTSPTRTEAQQLSFGIGKSFESGTALRGDVQAAKRGFEGLPGGIDADGYESSLSFSLRQSLWKNSFGSTNSTQRKINSIASESIDLNIVDRLENAALAVVGVFYRAWQAQLQGRAAEERLNRQKRLLSVTRIKAERGTAEKPDLLQVEAALSMSEERLQDARKLATDFWKQLVIGLNLPAQYAAMDALTIPLTLGSILSTGEKSCTIEFPENAARVRAIGNSSTIADLNLSMTQDATRPDLYLEARLNSNGIDPELSPTLSDATSAKNPQTAIALGFEMALSNPKEEADRLEALKQKSAMEIRMAQLRTQYNIERDALCRDLERFRTKVQTLKSVVEKQKARERAEEERFRLGKADTTNVIMAGNDVTDAEFSLRAAEGDYFQTAWKLVYQSGQLSQYLEPFKSQLGTP
jgi:outer membrane protein TolC